MKLEPIIALVPLLACRVPTSSVRWPRSVRDAHTAPSSMMQQRAPTMRSEALEGGRPSSAISIDSQTFAKLIRETINARNHNCAGDDPPAHIRAWLELQNGENVLVSFEHLPDDTMETCTMRVRQTRQMAECNAENPEACRDLGCVAVRWNLRTREGVVVDLFKAKKGQRVNCDISSADNPSVKWGQLMLRVVDDMAAMLDIRHVYLADESSVQMAVWNERTKDAQSVQVMLKYIRPLLDGFAYYERSGYYDVPGEGPTGTLPLRGHLLLSTSKRNTASWQPCR